MNKLTKHNMCSASLYDKMLRCCMFRLRAAKWVNEWELPSIPQDKRKKDPQCLKKQACFYFSFFFTEKKSVDTEKHSHSWELRLITVDVRWALGSTVMGWKWVIIVLSRNSGQLRPCETSHLPEIQRCLSTNLHHHCVIGPLWQEETIRF